MVGHEKNMEANRQRWAIGAQNYDQELRDSQAQAVADHEAELARRGVTWAEDNMERQPINDVFIQRDFDMRPLGEALPGSVCTINATECAQPSQPTDAAQPRGSLAPTVPSASNAAPAVDSFSSPYYVQSVYIKEKKAEYVYTSHRESYICVRRSRNAVREDVQSAVTTEAEYHRLLQTDEDWSHYMARVRDDKDARPITRVQDKNTNRLPEDETQWHFSRAINKCKGLGVFSEFEPGMIWGQSDSNNTPPGVQSHRDNELATPTFYGFQARHPRPMGIGLGYKGYDWLSTASQSGENITPDMLPPNEDQLEAGSGAFQVVEEEGKVWLDCTEPLHHLNPCTQVAKGDVPSLRDLLEGKVERPGQAGRGRGVGRGGDPRPGRSVAPRR